MTTQSIPTEITRPNWARFKSRVSGGAVGDGAIVCVVVGLAVLVTVEVASITGEGEARSVGAG